MINKEGYKIIAYTGVVLVVLAVASYFSDCVTLWVISGLVAVIFVFHFFFFRDPERNTPPGENIVVSPADGYVIKVDRVEEPYFSQKPMQRVAIFMTVFDVHVNRIPISGTVKGVKYIKGKFKAAFEDNAALQNEQNVIALDTKYGLLIFVQIAGLIARRIVSHLKEGETVKTGERFGMIKYSSRVDVYFPEQATIKVIPKQRVKAGETIIGEF